MIRCLFQSSATDEWKNKTYCVHIFRFLRKFSQHWNLSKEHTCFCWCSHHGSSWTGRENQGDKYTRVCNTVCIHYISSIYTYIYIYIYIYMCIHIALHRILIFHSWNFDNFGASLPKTFWIIWTAEPQLTQLSTLCLEVQELILKPDILAGNYQ